MPPPPLPASALTLATEDWLCCFRLFFSISHSQSRVIDREEREYARGTLQDKLLPFVNHHQVLNKLLIKVRGRKRLQSRADWATTQIERRVERGCS